MASADVLRGMVMVLMAIDHVRVYSGVPAGGPTAGVFFTRWVTHFCAPGFAFLAGSGVFLYAQKHSGVSKFLATRGLWLVLLELTVVRVAWTFNFHFLDYDLAGVLWMLGWCMVMMAALVKLPIKVVGAVGLAIICLHNLMDHAMPGIVKSLETNPYAALWKFLYVGFWAGPVQMGAHGPTVYVLYSLIPWIGVMAAGYAFGSVFALTPERRRQVCMMVGLVAIAAFVLLRATHFYGDPRPWQGWQTVHGMPPLLAFLNTTKYPASLCFLLMTLGPAILAIPLFESGSSAFAKVMMVYGRVPFFFYLLHIPLIHALALIVSKIRFGYVDPWLFTNHPMGNPQPPDGYVWSLPLLYLVWAIAVFLLFFACRWYAAVKARHKDGRLRYL
ncbi:DUF1624 domain-containing protein [Candidatus Korobacter versatilis]|uniref:DUF1624 domain-containing protein n=1 Tax=Candidatus Korobacter versatilis TaxID=658062 RepID=UPI000315958F|nr:heparan-alpha-glucosaminide N-acetyltransferase domain-containing protein [Candidatus Koribacter versatilis]